MAGLFIEGLHRLGERERIQASQRALRRHPTEPGKPGHSSRLLSANGRRRFGRKGHQFRTEFMDATELRLEGAQFKVAIRAPAPAIDREHHGLPMDQRASRSKGWLWASTRCAVAGHRSPALRRGQECGSTQVFDIAAITAAIVSPTRISQLERKSIELVLEGHDIRLSGSEAEDDPAGGNLRCDQSGEKGNKFQEDRHGGAPAEVERKAGREGRPAGSGGEADHELRSGGGNLPARAWWHEGSSSPSCRR